MIPARSTDPQTSHDAAVTINMAALEQTVFDAISAAGGLTTHELSERLSLSLVSVSPRMRPLCRKGKIMDSGERRAGSNGRKSIVWAVAR